MSDRGRGADEHTNLVTVRLDRGRRRSRARDGNEMRVRRGRDTPAVHLANKIVESVVFGVRERVVELLGERGDGRGEESVWVTRDVVGEVLAGMWEGEGVVEVVVGEDFGVAEGCVVSIGVCEMFCGGVGAEGGEVVLGCEPAMDACV